MNYNKPEDCDAIIEDIGHALSNVCRFSGHLPRFYSVAQHAVNASYVVQQLPGGASCAFDALMHDTAEAFTNDLPTPLKAAFPVFKQLEEKIEAAMGRRFGFSYPLPEPVKVADTIMLGLEKEHVKKNLSDWAVLSGVDYNAFKQYVDLTPCTPNRAYAMFMDRYKELTNG
jgi:hypothetical protein